MSFFTRWLGGGEARPARNNSGQGYLIEFDMMVKGSVYKRRSGLVRQFGVTVDGATRLVTSGDVVDRQTFEALVAAGAIRRPQPTAENPAAVQAAADIKEAVAKKAEVNKAEVKKAEAKKAEIKKSTGKQQAV